MNFWNSDHIFRMGSTHQVCEDYSASSGSTLSPNACHAVLGDGCSLCLDSNGHPIPAYTDFGSRLLTRAARLSFVDLNRVFGSDNCLRYIAETASRWCKDIGFGLNTLSSTLLMSWINDLENVIHWFTCGDGTFAFRDRETKGWTIANIMFDSGMPYYLRYELNSDDLRRYSLAGGCDFYIRRWVLKSDGTIGEPWDVFHRWEGRRVPSYSSHIDIRQFDMIVMFSDGISSFVKKDPRSGVTVSVPVTDAIRPFLAIKNYRGEFVYRRANAALKQFAERGITHTDDFSMIAIYAE